MVAREEFSRSTPLTDVSFFNARSVVSLLAGFSKGSRISSTGAVAADEIVQLYVRDEVSSVTRPVLELKGFECVSLAPGERRVVKFTLGAEHFSFTGKAMRPVVEPGAFTIQVGPSSWAGEKVRVEIVA